MYSSNSELSKRKKNRRFEWMLEMIRTIVRWVWNVGNIVISASTSFCRLLTQHGGMLLSDFTRYTPNSCNQLFKIQKRDLDVSKQILHLLYYHFLFSFDSIMAWNYPITGWVIYCRNTINSLEALKTLIGS